MPRLSRIVPGLAIFFAVTASQARDFDLERELRSAMEEPASQEAQAKPQEVAEAGHKLAQEPPAQAQAPAPSHGDGVGHSAAAPGEGDPWSRLVQGNRRHQSGNWSHPHLNISRREELGNGQKPFAAILACADSRVAPELVFDQGLGDLFVVRVAGNVAGPFDRASLEYGVEHLGIGLLVVLGHEKCGAVKASLEVASKPGSEAGLSPDLKSLVHEIAPAVKGKGMEELDQAVTGNARYSAQRLLEQSALLREAVNKGHLKLVVGRYDLDSGEVSVLH